MTTQHHHTNHLIHESSPYLLQHAHNPVDWYPWGNEALENAKQEDKPMLVSIGYSACHWCHVMERECFEDEQVAKLMNEHFICIKVDREERPDIDQVYMSAVQLMTGGGGWPLNCFTLPDGRPIYGGTYFPKVQWIQVLTQLASIYKEQRDKAEKYAERLTHGINTHPLTPFPRESEENSKEKDRETLLATVAEWSKHFDNNEGGMLKAPKFPLPNNYLFLLRHAFYTKDETLLKHVNLTLEKMALGGIYDHIGGGFARYSTDAQWKVPHFEKMLYDNAQLVSLYSEAFQLTKNPLYKQVVYETIDFVLRELTSSEGAFYSALDADSEGDEGKYYVWKKEELQEILEGPPAPQRGDFDLCAQYFNINNEGYWEHSNYILLRKKTDEQFAQEMNIAVDALEEKVAGLKKKLFERRQQRVRPGLDDKMLTSWNALMLQGLADAYKVFNEQIFLDAAIKSANFILQKQKRTDGGLFHNYKAPQTTQQINGYLEDYCFTIEAFISLYQVTFNERWLREAKYLLEYANTHFYDNSYGMFWFTSDLDAPLIARKMEISDNVIPASNSSMAKNLFFLGHYFGDEEYISRSRQMLYHVKDVIPTYGSGYSNWAMLLQYFAEPFYEVAIVGEKAEGKRKEFAQYFLPGCLFLGSHKESTLPLLENKYLPGKTMIHVCENKTCSTPVAEVSEALAMIKDKRG